MLRFPHYDAVPVMKSSAFAFSYPKSFTLSRAFHKQLRTRLIQSFLSISEVPWSTDVTIDVTCKVLTTNSITAAAFSDTCQWRTARALVNLSRPTRNIQAIELSESRIFIKSRHCKSHPVAYLLARHLQTQATQMLKPQGLLLQVLMVTTY